MVALLALMLALSLFSAALPSIAATGTWTAQTSDINLLLAPAGVDIIDLAVNGDTMYAATGATTDNITYTSTNGGATWTSLYTTTSYPKRPTLLVTVAADNASVVAIVSDENKVYYSTNSGSSWSTLGIPATGATINDIDVSKGPTHYVAAGGQTTGGVAELWTMKLPACLCWGQEYFP